MVHERLHLLHQIDQARANALPKDLVELSSCATCATVSVDRGANESLQASARASVKSANRVILALLFMKPNLPSWSVCVSLAAGKVRATACATVRTSTYMMHVSPI